MSVYLYINVRIINVLMLKGCLFVLLSNLYNVDVFKKDCWFLKIKVLLDWWF